MRSPVFALVCALAVPLAADAAAPTYVEELRRVPPEQLGIPVQKVVTPNGLVVLLSPDATTSSALVSMTFRAGALYEPPGRSGMAHLVEHLMFSGPTPESDYGTLLQSRRARYLNASTGFDHMSFDAIVPADELPAALWVAADRLGTLPSLIDAGLVERHRKVVVQERAYRFVDEPYGLVDELVFSRLFADPHPLHAGVVGSEKELASVTAEDVRAFVRERLVPANAVLTLVGRFDPEAALRLISEGLGRLPSGRAAEPPALWPMSRGSVEKKEERLGRLPRVTLAWRFPNIPHDHATALRLGAQMLSMYTDGAWGMRLDADFAEYAGEGAFRMDVTVPYAETVGAVQSDAEGFLRMLTRVEMPADLVLAANLAMDRSALFGLDTLAGRARLLTYLELSLGSSRSAEAHLAQHWEIERDVVRDVARVYLKRPKVVVHARPTRPRPARAERE